MRLKPFTLIGATTRPGMLTGPLRDRFHLREHLGFYSLADLTEIVRRSAKKLGVSIEEAAALEIARRSRSTPRLANNRLKWVRDYADAKANGDITLGVAQAALEMASIDTEGLDKQDRAYLQTLIRVFGGGPAGVDAIAHTMNIAPDTLEDEVEPFLLRTEFVVRTPRGRVATTKAYQHLQLPPPTLEKEPQSRLFE
jgi:Holliday junction DNA helicase RuvB